MVRRVICFLLGHKRLYFRNLPEGTFFIDAPASWRCDRCGRES